MTILPILAVVFVTFPLWAGVLLLRVTDTIGIRGSILGQARRRSR